MSDEQRTMQQPGDATTTRDRSVLADQVAAIALTVLGVALITTIALLVK